MNASSDHNSPMSSSEMISGSASPFAPKQVATRKQRSSSVNSVSSNVSNQRSMSIVSLESPRNSIVSVEDTSLRRVCNSSTTSLTSLAPVTSPTEQKEHYTISNRIHKPRAKPSSAVFSDEDSESEITLSRFRWRRRSSEKGLTSFLPILKRDFKFRYGGPFGLPKTPAQKPVDDIAPSPLSFSAGLHHHHNQHQHPVPLSPNPPHISSHPADYHLSSPHSLHLSSSVPNLHSNTGPFPQNPLNASTNTALPKTEADPMRPSSLGKKFRTSSATQSIFLKKRLLLSKDIQHELGSPQGSPLVSPTSLISTETRFPSVSSSASVTRSSPNLSRSDSASTVVIPMPLHPDNCKQSAPVQPLPDTPSSLAEEGLVKNQNKLIYELNRKWNKTFFDAKSPEKKYSFSDMNKGPSAPSRKRNRSASTSSMESSRSV